MQKLITLTEQEHQELLDKIKTLEEQNKAKTIYVKEESHYHPHYGKETFVSIELDKDWAQINKDLETEVLRWKRERILGYLWTKPECPKKKEFNYSRLADYILGIMIGFVIFEILYKIYL